ncbi:MAG TPA: tetratricopeptide repeat protein [Ktedonobacterales bacterium]
MAGGDGQGHSARQGGRGASGVILTQTQRTQVETLVAQTSALAQALREAGDRATLVERLTQAVGMDESVAQGYAERLGGVRGAEALAAADVALALGELDTRHEVAREARRSGVRLRSAGALPTLAIPAASVTPAPSAAFSAPATPRAPIFDEAWVSRTRESGELTLITLWREGSDADILRSYHFLLDFYTTGVKDFQISDTLTRREVRQRVIEPLQSDGMPAPVKVGWAQARGLLMEALEVTTWRGSTLPADFVRYRPQVEERLLAEPTDDAQRAEIAREQERFAREGDRPLCTAGLEHDETLANWLGAWSFGDFGLVYDLLASEHPIHKAQSRNEYVAQRRQWADEAHPANLRLTLIREQAQRASALWTPGVAPGRLGAGNKRDLEAFWSLELSDSQLGGQLEELPMGTLTSKSSGRHWFWSAATVQRDLATNMWLISATRDEGAQAQGLPVEELTKRIKEAHERAEKTAQEAPQDLDSEKSVEALREVTGDLTAALHYSDALMARMPLDEDVPRKAVNDARTLSAHERAAAILERIVGRFGDDIEVRFELGVEQYLVAEQFNQVGQQQSTAAWMGRATATLMAVCEDAPTPRHLQGLGELLTRQGHYNQAAQRLREAIALDNTIPTLYIDLAETLMGIATDDNLDAPAPIEEPQRSEVMREALQALRDGAKLDANTPRLFTRMGAIYEALHQHEDAVIAFEEAIRREPHDDVAHYTLGTLFMARRDYQRALPLLETANHLNPMSVQYHLAIASCYIALEQGSDARREIGILEQMAPGLPQVAELKSALARLTKK